MNHRILARGRSRPTGFSLTELLVVILIIAVLAAILFPFSRMMRRRAESINCLRQMQSWGNAFASYSAENNGKINWEHWPSISNDPLKCSPYVPYWSGDSTLKSGFSTQLSQRYCPSVKWDKTGNQPVCYATIQPIGVKGVGISGRASGKSSDYPLARIQTPARFMLMIEATGAGYSVSTRDQFISKVKPLTEDGDSLRHDHRLHALFADFSVRPMNWPDIESGLDSWSTF